MNAPAPRKSGGKKSLTASAGAITILAGLLVTAEYRAHVAYRDPAGVLTVCEGLTGAWIEEGRYYSNAECEQRTRTYIENMTAKMGRCVGALTDKQWIAWGHFTYNTGTTAFCNSTAARFLREGHHAQACGQMMRWTFITKPGIGRVDCKVKAHKCGGIATRRQTEYGMCMDALEEAR